ncbi:MAG: glycosyltransferase family 4 protein [Burkholderiales bacterium]|nr:glycosyltransferase family 4 protein [Burkholderiales bacterium]
MRVLLIHQNFPGQFKHLARHLHADPAVELLAIGRKTAPGLPGGPGFMAYDLAREPGKETHKYVRSIESAVLYGQAVVRVLLELKRKGWKPDVVLAHLGWGEALYVKEVFPDTRLLGLCEFFHHAAGVDLGYDPEFPATIDDRLRVRTGNGHVLVSLESTDVGISATPWQRSLFPTVFQPKIEVVHEGIDVDQVVADPAATLRLPDGTVLRAGDRVVTYVARNLEPYRGFHVFMRAARRILERVPDCHVVFVGGDNVSYGRRPKGAAHWREKMLAEVPLDPGRAHFLGWVPYDTYRKVLQVSAAHVYLTYPFVLSWSLLEAMSASCLVIGSRTPPVAEVVEEGRTGLLVDFFDVDGIADRVVEALVAPGRFAPLRRAARDFVRARFDVDDSIRAYRDLIGLRS